MNSNEKVLWVANRNFSVLRTDDGFALVNCRNNARCDLDLLSGSVWLLIDWTPAGIRVEEVVDLLRHTERFPKRIREAEIQLIVNDLALRGFVHKRLAQESETQGEEHNYRTQKARLDSTVRQGAREVWAISQTARCRHANSLSVVSDVNDGPSFRLNGIGPKLWHAMERAQAQVSIEELVRELEPHLSPPREEWEGIIRQCLFELQRRGLVSNELLDGEATCERTGAPLASAQNPVSKSVQTLPRAVWEKPSMQPIENFDSYIHQVFPQATMTNLGWRARRLKGFIDELLNNGNGSLVSAWHQPQLALSARQARRLFKRAVGISIREYARKTRLVHAAKRLQSTDNSMKAIAIDSGYNTQFGFRKSFHELFGLTPAEFRQFWQQHQSA